MSAKHERARICGLNQDRAVVLTKFPNAPLARIQIIPPQLDGVVLDIHELRELVDALDGITEEIEAS